jgi:uncharacterized cupredoxin-like copper-binding protein
MTRWQPTHYDPELHRQRMQGQQPPMQQDYPRPYPQEYGQPYLPQPSASRYARPQQQPLRRKSWMRRHKFLTTLMAFVVLTVIIVLANPGGGTKGASGGTSAAPPAARAAVQQPAKAAPAMQTVTYVVTGSDAAQVTYGPAGSDLSGGVPMHVTKDIPSSAPVYYAISAQLQGSGSVSCQILVDGKVISSSTANGGYNIASCEIGQDPLSGAWQDDNTG